MLDADLEFWRNRPLSHFHYLMVDARYEKVRYANEIRDCAVLWAIGIQPDGKREVLGVHVAFSEAEIKICFSRNFMEWLPHSSGQKCSRSYC